MNPMINIHDCETGEMITREMTDAEYAEVLASGWTPYEPDNEVPE
jgi:hypothetical protein